MTVTWIHLGMVLLGALATALLQRSQQPAATPAPTPTTSTHPLLSRILGNRPATPTAGSASQTSHPVISSLVSVLESTIAQNPQLAQLEGAIVTLLHPNGNVNLSLTQGGSHVASPTAPAPAVQPAAAVSQPAASVSGS